MGLGGGRERALRLSGRGDYAAACIGEGMATRRVLVAWAVLDGAERQGRPLLAATGGSATAEDADDEVPHHHRHLRPSKRSGGALDKKKE